MPSGPFDQVDSLIPEHGLGAPLKHGMELASNREMGKRAQSRATVHPLEAGVTGKGIGRHGRKGRVR